MTTAYVHVDCHTGVKQIIEIARTDPCKIREETRVHTDAVEHDRYSLGDMKFSRVVFVAVISVLCIFPEGTSINVHFRFRDNAAQ